MSKLIRIAVAGFLAIGALQACKPGKRIKPDAREVSDDSIGAAFVGTDLDNGSQQAVKELADRHTARALSDILYERTMERRLRAVDKNIEHVGDDVMGWDPATLTDLKKRRARVEQDWGEMKAYGGSAIEPLKQRLEADLAPLEKDAADAAAAIAEANSRT